MKKFSNFFSKVVYLVLAISFLNFALNPLIKNLINPAQELTYVKTVQLIAEKQVESIELYTNNSRAEIHLKGDEKRYTTTIPNDDVFCKFVQETISVEDSFTITRTKKRIWPNVLFFLLAVYNFKKAFSIEKNKEEELQQEENIEKTNLLKDLLNFEIDYSKRFVKSEIHFSDVAGLKEEKEELIEIVDFLKNPDKYTKIGAKVPRGILLSGSPGTGKTLLAKALAGESDVAFIATSGTEFDNKYVGVGASNIRNLFEKAKEKAPCIIFIDEIDAVGFKRTESSDTPYVNQTIEQLLVEMDGFDPKSNVVVVAATNRPESLDPALVRPGRFDRNIAINLPDVQDREEILKIHGKNKTFSADLNFNSIAHNTAGFTGAELENLLNEAAFIAARRNCVEISQEHIEEALRKITIGLQKKGRIISEKERRLTAYHEAGHAVVSKFLPTQNNVKEISIVPRGNAGGYTLHDTVEDKTFASKTELNENLITLLGGRAAEQIALHDISTGASNDLKVATQIAREMIGIYGMNPELGPISLSSVKNDILGTDTMSLALKLITQSLKEAEEKAKQILTEHNKLLDVVANTLLEKETISGSELEEIFKEYK